MRKVGRISVLVFSLIMALALVLSGCGGSKPAEKKDAPAGGGDKVVKIGVPTPMSAPGDYKSGEINLNTLKMGAEQINAAGGVNGSKIELVIGDDQGNTSKGVSLVQKMISEDKVCAILGPWHGSVALAQAKVADEKKVPIMLHYSWPDEITAMHSDYVFRTSPFNSEIADLLIPYLKSKNYKTIAVLAEDSSYGTGFGSAMKKAAEKEGMAATLVVFPSNAIDFTPQLMDLKRAKPQPELLIVASVYQPMYLIPKQAHEVGLSPKTQIMAGWDYPSWSPDFWKTVGEAGKGILYPAFESASMNLTPLGQKFKKDYKEKYKTDPPIYAYFLYDELMMVVEAVKKTGGTDPVKIAAALKDMEFEGTTGKVRFERKEGPVWNQWMGHQTFIMQLNNVGDMGDKAELIFPKK